MKEKGIMSKKQRLAILGCTSSIGRQTLSVVSLHPDLFEVTALTAHTDGEGLFCAAKETGAIVVSEEHNIVGGLGEAVAGYLSGVYPVPVIRHGVEDVFGCSGKAEKVLEYFGLSPEGIAAKARQAVEAKRK